LVGDETIPKKKEEEPEKNRILMRKIGGIMAMAVGIPNFLTGCLLTLGGIAVTIALGVMVYQLYTGDSGDDPLKTLCIVFLLILAIIGLILAIIFTILSFIFAIGVAGQSLGGYYGFRGLRYNRAIFLTLIGSIVSLIAGIGLFVAGLSMKDPERWVKIGALVWGGYDIFAFFVTMTSMVLFIKTKSTFTEPQKKLKKSKSKKKRKEKSEKEEDWDG